jgi:hypothetical protein
MCCGRKIKIKGKMLKYKRCNYKYLDVWSEAKDIQYVRQY